MIPLALAPSIAQGVLGAGQMLGGLLKKTKRPTMKVPDAVKRATAIAEMDANQTVRPGRDIAENAIKSGSQTALSNVSRTAGSGSDIIAAMAGIKGLQDKAMQEQDLIDVDYKVKAKETLRDQLGKMGEWQNRAFQYNEAEKYDEESATKSALTEGGIQNIVGAGKEVVGQNIISGGNLFEGLNKFLNKKTQPVKTNLAKAVMKQGRLNTAADPRWKIGLM
jgi:hypothetical protein